MLKITLFIFCFLYAFSNIYGQNITLEDCHRLAKSNYPTIKKLDLISKTTDYDLQNANKKFIPQVSFSGQATYQSEVVNYGDLLGSNSLPAGITPPVLSKDQYRLQGEINQLLYDGGSTKNQKELITANKALQEQSIESNLYAINNRINTLYFSILLMDEQLKQNQINKASLQTQLDKTTAAFANGVAFRSNIDELKAELINIEMVTIEFKTNRTAYLKMLEVFIGKELDAPTILNVPQVEVISNVINRPELKTYKLQQSIYEVEKKALRSSYLPQINAFFQGAYGRPTLNVIENKFGPWYMTGIRLNWNLGSLYTLANKKNSLSTKQELTEVDKETFLMNTKLDVIQQEEQVKKYRGLILQDEEAIALRSSITKAAEAQLNNGVITIHEYIQKLNAENLAKQTKILHQIQLLQAQYNQKFITGN